MVLAILIVSFLNRPLEADDLSVRFEEFKSFIHGDINVREAVVYRRISTLEGNLINQEWYRFGFQKETWFAQRLKPSFNDPKQLFFSQSIALYERMICRIAL